MSVVVAEEVGKEDDCLRLRWPLVYSEVTLYWNRYWEMKGFRKVGTRLSHEKATVLEAVLTEGVAWRFEPATGITSTLITAGELIPIGLE